MKKRVEKDARNAFFTDSKKQKSMHKKIISNLLQRYLLKNKYDKIILHLQNNIIKCVSDSVKNSIKTEISDNVTSKKSLKSLDHQRLKKIDV